jgi:hypothetical protein
MRYPYGERVPFILRIPRVRPARALWQCAPVNEAIAHSTCHRHMSDKGPSWPYRLLRQTRHAHASIWPHTRLMRPNFHFPLRPVRDYTSSRCGPGRDHCRGHGRGLTELVGHISGSYPLLTTYTKIARPRRSGRLDSRSSALVTELMCDASHLD